MLYKVLVFLGISLLSHEAFSKASIPIRNIQVDVTGKTALEARENALTKARQLAFVKLAAENPSFNISTTQGMPQDAVLESLVDDYEIVREKMSNIRYIGTFNINFNERALQRYLAGPRRLVKPNDPEDKANLAKTLRTPEGRSVIIAIYIGPDSSYLWEENNPWGRYWVKEETKNKGKIGKNSFTVPLGDLRDILTLTIEDAMTSKLQQIASIIERYQAEFALVTILRSLDDGVNSHEFQVKTFTRTGMQQETEPMTIQGQTGATLDDVFKNAVRKTFAPIGGKEEQVEAGVVAAPREESPTFTVSVSFDTFQDWQAIRQSLNKSDYIDNYDVLNLNRQQANIQIKSRVAISVLKSKLASLGLSLTTGGGKARLTLASRAPAPRDPIQRMERVERQIAPLEPQYVEEEVEEFEGDGEGEGEEALAFHPEVIE